VIRKLRSALADTSETPRYIETLPRRGYRFIGALDPDPETASAAESALATGKPMPSGHEPAVQDEATSSTATTTAPVRRARLSALALIAALAAAALLTGTYALWRTRFGTSGTSVRVEAPPQSHSPRKSLSLVQLPFPRLPIPLRCCHS
jgi:hypothetical protein